MSTILFTTLYTELNYFVVLLSYKLLLFFNSLYLKSLTLYYYYYEVIAKSKSMSIHKAIVT
jgi:hypothetical protein